MSMDTLKFCISAIIGGTSAGVIAGAVVGVAIGLILLAAIIVLVLIILLQRKRTAGEENVVSGEQIIQVVCMHYVCF